MGNSFEWMELEAVLRKIANAKVRLAAASSSDNYGLVGVLEQQIAEAEQRRARLLSLITTQITNLPVPAVGADVSGSGTGQTTAPVKRAHGGVEPGSKRAESLDQVEASPTPVPRGAAKGMKIIEGDNKPGSEHIERIEQTKVTKIWMPSDSSQITGGTERRTSVWETKPSDLEHATEVLRRRRADTLARHAEEITALESDQTEIEALERAIDAFARKRVARSLSE